MGGLYTLETMSKIRAIGAYLGKDIARIVDEYVDHDWRVIMNYVLWTFRKGYKHESNSGGCCEQECLCGACEDYDTGLECKCCEMEIVSHKIHRCLHGPLERAYARRHKAFVLYNKFFIPIPQNNGLSLSVKYPIEYYLKKRRDANTILLKARAVNNSG
jgi:hypothetical protein